MKSPLCAGAFIELEEVSSTQDAAARLLLETEHPPGVVLAMRQVAGRGRLGRRWLSEGADSLTMSMVFLDYRDHPMPWLLGMASAIAAARALHAKLQWPNDILLQGRKLGGVLTELYPDREGRKVAVVGMGINLNQQKFPESIAGSATSLAMHRRGPFVAKEVAQRILDEFGELPEPDQWAALEPYWTVQDTTAGKKFKLQDGGVGIALGIGPEGELICQAPSGVRKVYAADSILREVDAKREPT